MEWRIHTWHDSFVLVTTHWHIWFGVSREYFLHTFIMSDIWWVMSHTQTVCCVWVSHFAGTRVMAHTDESHTHTGYIWVSHVAYLRVMAHTNEPHTHWHTYLDTNVTQTLHANASRMNESGHIWMSHVIYEWVMSHMNESCRTWMRHFKYEWVMAHMNARMSQLHASYHV